MSVLLSLLPALLSAASAGELRECPFDGATRYNVQLRWGHAVVNGERYSLRFGSAQNLERDLRACGEFEAAEHLQAWRVRGLSARGLTVTGMLVVWPALVPAAIVGSMALHERRSLEESLEGALSPGGFADGAETIPEE